MTTPSIFISYSHCDKKWRDLLVTQLQVLEIEPESWDDRKIEGGAPWETEIETAIDQAQIAILLVSAQFLTSEFIKKKEVPRLLERHKAGGLRIYPIIVSACAWNLVPWLKVLQCRPTDGKALSTFPEHGVDEQLTAIAMELADLMGKRESEPPPKPTTEAVARAIDELLEGRGNVAKAPSDVEAAINVGIADVARVVTELASKKKKITVDDLDQVISTAIQHGAGIYNHSHFGRTACARIYHRAASSVLELMPSSRSVPSGAPSSGADLAAGWLRDIVSAAPLVTDSIAEDLAWELRYAFDATHVVGLCDSLYDALVDANWQESDGDVACSVIGAIIEQTRNLRQPQLVAYVLRHAAQVLVWLIQERKHVDRAALEFRTRVVAILSEHERITRENVVQLAETLHHALVDLCRAMVASAGSGPKKPWLGSWFGKN